MGHHQYLYKLNIITGIALIPLEVTADDHTIGEKSNMIYFHESGYRTNTTIAWYPSGSTIIRERIDNPDYVRYHERRRNTD